MYFLATLHPRVQDMNSVYKEMYFSRADKEREILRFYRERLNIPLCLDHCGGESLGVTVSTAERIGRVLDLFIGRDGSMMTKMQLDDRHPAYQKIKNGLHQKREKWGVSVWIQIMENKRTGAITKKLGHVALTTNPLFASHNTFMHWYAVIESGIDKKIAEDFYREGQGESFASRDLKLKIQGVSCGRPSSPNTKFSHI